MASALAMFAVAYVIAEIAMKTPRNMVSLGGMAALVLFTFLFSHNPARVCTVINQRTNECNDCSI